jgi:hypothetical protein
MKNLNSCGSIITLLLILFLCVPAPGLKGQLKKMTDQDLTVESTAVFHGKCSYVRSDWNETKDMIMTSVTLVPEQYMKGNLGGEVVVLVPGGRVGDIVYEVSEMPVFTEGEEVVAFVWTNPSGKNLITGGSQGRLKIQKDELTGRKVVKKKEKDSRDIDEPLVSYVEKIKGYMK